jgi:hypothetical protein
VIELSSRRRLFSVGSALTQASKAVPRRKVEAVVVEQRDASLWPEFSGCLEAVERVGIGSLHRWRRAGRSLWRTRAGERGDSVITFDPASYAAEVDRAKAEMLAAPLRVMTAAPFRPPSTLAIGELMRTKSDSELLRIDD